MRHGGAGATGAQLHHVLQRDPGHVAAESLREAPPVRVLAAPPAVAQHHRVHRPQRSGIQRQFIEQRDHRLLAWVRDVETIETHALCGQQQVRQRLASQPQPVQVDLSIDVVQTLLGTFLLVHERRAGQLDAGPDQTDQQAFPVRDMVRAHRHGILPGYPLNGLYCLSGSLLLGSSKLTD